MRLLRALSLDVVAGAACGGLLAEFVTGARMLPVWWIALLTAVWSIYTGDHLLDAFSARGPLATHRHDFHRRHARALTIGLAAAVLCGLVASIALRPPVRAMGLALTALVLCYLASAQGLVLRSLPKEPMAGLLYAAGIWGGPLIMSDAAPWQLGAAGLHAAAAVLNLAALGLFETEVDRQQGSRSLGLRFGPARVRQSVLIVSLLFCWLALWMAFKAPHEALPAFAVLSAQIAMPAAMLLASDWFTQAERYRVWGDSVFFLGALPRLLA